MPIEITEPRTVVDTHSTPCLMELAQVKEQLHGLPQIGNLTGQGSIYEPSFAPIGLQIRSSDRKGKSSSGPEVLGALGFWNAEFKILFREIQPELIPATVCLVLAVIAFMLVCAL